MRGTTAFDDLDSPAEELSITPRSAAATDSRSEGLICPKTERPHKVCEVHNIRYRTFDACFGTGEVGSSKLLHSSYAASRLLPEDAIFETRASRVIQT